MSPSLIDILFRPDAFFGKVMSENESLKIPALIVLVGSIIAAIYGYLIGGLTAKMMAACHAGDGDNHHHLHDRGSPYHDHSSSGSFGPGFSILSIAVQRTGIVYQNARSRGIRISPPGSRLNYHLIAAILYIPKITVPTLSKAALARPGNDRAGDKRRSCTTRQ